MKKIICIVLTLFLVNVSAQIQTVAKVLPTNAPSQNNNPQAPLATGVLLVDQQPDQANGFFADVDCDNCSSSTVQVIADDFVLANNETITQIVIWTGYFPGNVPLATDNFTVTIHSDNTGAPGAIIYSETNVPSTRATTGVVLFGVDEYRNELTLATPASLTAGIYWLEIHNDSTGSAETVLWETGTLDASTGAVANSAFAIQFPVVNWMPISGGNLAFQLYAGLTPPTPVPSLTWLGLALLILTLGFFGRRFVK